MKEIVDYYGKLKNDKFFTRWLEGTKGFISKKSVLTMFKYVPASPEIDNINEKINHEYGS